MGWLGAQRRTSLIQRGIIEMGVRTYIPQLGRFLQRDPVDGGSANAYDYVNQDPLNAYDLDGRMPCESCRRVGEFWKRLVTPYQRDAYYTTEVVCCGTNGMGTAVATGVEYKVVNGIRTLMRRFPVTSAAATVACGAYSASKGIDRFGRT